MPAAASKRKADDDDDDDDDDDEEEEDNDGDLGPPPSKMQKRKMFATPQWTIEQARAEGRSSRRPKVTAQPSPPQQQQQQQQQQKTAATPSRQQVHGKKPSTRVGNNGGKARGTVRAEAKGKKTKACTTVSDDDARGLGGRRRHILQEVDDDALLALRDRQAGVTLFPEHNSQARTR